MNYLYFLQKGLRTIIKLVLAEVAKNGLQGENHFYITFDPGYPGVILSEQVKKNFKEKITIVLQYDFSDLKVFDDRFEVMLSFDEVYETISVPFDSIYRFYDPAESFALDFIVERSDEQKPHFEEIDNIISIDSLRKKREERNL